MSNAQIKRMLSWLIVAVIFCLIGVKFIVGTAKAKVMREPGATTLANTPQATNSSLPPIPAPFINSVVEGKRKIIFRNPRREPLRVIAEIEVSDNAYGNGFLTFTNLSHKGLAALRGEFLITTKTGDVIKDGWSFSYGGKIFTPGEEWKVPVGGPISPIVDAAHKIVNVAVRITGLAFEDKSYWGDEGLVIAQKASLAAKNLGLVAAKVKAESLQMSTVEIANELARKVPNPIPLGEWNTGRFDLDPMNYMRFSRLLLDENKNLRVDHMQRLDGLIANCKKLSE